MFGYKYSREEGAATIAGIWEDNKNNCCGKNTYSNSGRQPKAGWKDRALNVAGEARHSNNCSWEGRYMYMYRNNVVETKCTAIAVSGREGTGNYRSGREDTKPSLTRKEGKENYCGRG